MFNNPEINKNFYNFFKDNATDEERTPGEIAEALTAYILGDIKTDGGEVQKQLDEAIFNLRATAENPYNSECFRTFYNALQIITSYFIPRF